MTITIEDIKTLESLFIVEMHSAERIFRVIENGLADIYRQSKDYKQLVKSNPNSKACKVDHIQCLCNGMMVYDLVNSKITK